LLLHLGRLQGEILPVQMGDIEGFGGPRQELRISGILIADNINGQLDLLHGGFIAADILQQHAPRHSPATKLTKKRSQPENG